MTTFSKTCFADLDSSLTPATSSSLPTPRHSEYRYYPHPAPHASPTSHSSPSNAEPSASQSQHQPCTAVQEACPARSDPAAESSTDSTPNINNTPPSRHRKYTAFRACPPLPNIQRSLLHSAAAALSFPSPRRYYTDVTVSFTTHAVTTDPFMPR
ncbi:hypothetical protein E2C01_054992 [Portunus trituberculatus]|uniref:Uncharacterized protein n=1 Tax=Portunus trituberculatus TaxID=210409 RepID=A0A5B7GQ21_PORTR|nr:hypothetical protein [Portunus trituberculatus]